MPNFPRRRAKNVAAQAKLPKTSRFSRFARRARGEGLDRPRHRGIYLLPNAFTTAIADNASLATDAISPSCARRTRDCARTRRR